MEESDLLIHPVSSKEAQTSLLSPATESQRPLRQLSCLPCNICVKSKAAMLILVWSIIIGAIYLVLLNSFGVIGFGLQHNARRFHIPVNVIVYTVIAAYAFLALVLLVYPLSGYLADIYCGRYKAVTISFALLWVAMLLLSCAAIIGITRSWKFNHFGLYRLILFGLLVSLSLILIITSLACYQANIIQLGLDQLLEAPSEKLGLFIHWLMWSYTLGSFITLMLNVFLPCYIDIKAIKEKWTSALSFTPFVSLLILTLLLAFTCYNHSWFYSEPGQNNPYKTVYRVLNFARKNKYPLCRSAFTYCDDFRPSRIDFAKERYGGPFTTPQVEDVKTFFRIVMVLLSLGPVFVLEVPGSYYLFPLFALHIDNKLQFIKDHRCHSVVKWVLLQSGSLGYITTVLFFPVYIWIVYSLLRKRIPRILNRLRSAIVMSVIGVLYLLTIDLIAHFQYHQHSPSNSTSGVCLFTSQLIKPHREHNPSLLNMHWGVVIPPGILLNLGLLLVQATTIEFISAQSPHSMKGLLVGVFFAIKGLFQFISAVVVVPFAIPKFWNGINPVTNCAFGYYLFTIVVALIGLVVFSVVTRRYKYRQRDERPYDPRFAEQYYERYIGSTPNLAAGVYSPSDEHMCHQELGHTDSGDTINSVSRDYGATRCQKEASFSLIGGPSKDCRRLHLKDNISSRVKK